MVILFIEDEAIIRHATAMILRKEGCQVMEAENGSQALDLLSKRDFDLVITDVSLPDQSGIVLADRIRARWPRMPIIVVSGYTSDEATKFLAQGVATEFVHKPFGAMDLMAAVRRLLPSKTSE